MIGGLSVSRGDGPHGPLARIVLRNAAGGAPGRKGVHLPPLRVLIKVGPMEMSSKNGVGPIAKTGFGKSDNLSTRQPAAEGGIGVFETALEVFDQAPGANGSTEF